MAKLYIMCRGKPEFPFSSFLAQWLTCKSSRLLLAPNPEFENDCLKQVSFV